MSRLSKSWVTKRKLIDLTNYFIQIVLFLDVWRFGHLWHPNDSDVRMTILPFVSVQNGNLKLKELTLINNEEHQGNEENEGKDEQQRDEENKGTDEGDDEHDGNGRNKDKRA